MKKLHAFLLTFFFVGSALAQQQNTPIATTTRAGKVKPDGTTITVDVDGTIHSAGGGGPTNGQTAAQVALQIKGSNDTVFATSYVGQVKSSGTNETFGSTTNIGVFVMLGTGSPTVGQVLVVAPGGIVSGVSGTGILTNGATLGYGKSPTFNGQSITNIPGEALQTIINLSTVNVSNLDFLTLLGSNSVNHQSYVVDTNAIIHFQTNGVDIGTIGTNGFIWNSGNSNFFGGVNYMQSNSAPYTTADNPTNQYHDVTLYTNGAYRGWLTGQIVQTVPTGGSSVIDLGYTNGPSQYGVMRFSMFQPCTNLYTPFTVPLSPGATFRFTVIDAGGASDAVTNAVFWIE